MQHKYHAIGVAERDKMVIRRKLMKGRDSTAGMMKETRKLINTERRSNCSGTNRKQYIGPK